MAEGGNGGIAKSIIRENYKELTIVIVIPVITIIVPNDGCLNFVDENDEVLLSGFGRKGKAKGDIPGVRFKVVKVSGVGLTALWKEKKEKPRS